MNEPLKFACIFPGQGSQSIGMMSGYGDFPVVRETFAEASDVLGEDFWTLAEQGPLDRLNMTVNTQPVMLIAGIAVYRAWKSLTDAKPILLAGHSLGEYTALVASGALSFVDALFLVRFRAEAMQRAAPANGGGMAALLGLDHKAVQAVCHDATDSAKGELLQPANFNSPRQTVVAGHKNAIARGAELARAAGAKRVVVLPVSIPSHCSLMALAADEMRLRLKQVILGSPQIPLLHNVDVRPHEDPDAIKEILVQQLCRPVQWTETIRAFAATGIDYVLECGPGGILSGLGRQTEKDLRSMSLADGTSLHHAAALNN